MISLDPRLMYPQTDQTGSRTLETIQRYHTRPTGKKDEKLHQACVEFESLFIKQMLNIMRKSVEKTDFLHGGVAEEIFEDMLYDEYSLQMAKTAGFGIADIIYKQLTPQAAGIIQADK